jgi:hypothetical protein
LTIIVARSRSLPDRSHPHKGVLVTAAVIAFGLFVVLPVLSVAVGADSRRGLGDSWKHQSHRGDL